MPIDPTTQATTTAPADPEANIGQPAPPDPAPEKNIPWKPFFGAGLLGGLLWWSSRRRM